MDLKYLKSSAKICDREGDWGLGAILLGVWLSDLLVSFARLLGKTMLLFNKVHLFAKKVLKSSAFPLKFVINLFWWNRGGIQGFFILFRKVFKMEQYVFDLEAGLANFI